MSFFNLILLLILLGFVWFGFWNGLIRTLGGIIGVFVAIFAASRWYDILSLKILPFLDNNLTLARLLSFIIVFIIVQFIIIFILKIIDKIFHFPILKFLNRLAGAAFGLIEGGLIIGLILYFSTKLPLGEAWLNLIEGSPFARFLISMGKILLPLIPSVLKQAQALL